MIFGKRTWAIRLLEAAGLSVTSSEGDAILRVLLHAAKSPSNLGRGDKGKVVCSAIDMVTDMSASDDLIELGLDRTQATYALIKLSAGVDAMLDQHIAERPTI